VRPSLLLLSQRERDAGRILRPIPNDRTLRRRVPERSKINIHLPDVLHRPWRPERQDLCGPHADIQHNLWYRGRRRQTVDDRDRPFHRLRLCKVFVECWVHEVPPTRDGIGEALTGGVRDHGKGMGRSSRTIVVAIGVVEQGTIARTAEKLLIAPSTQGLALSCECEVDMPADVERKQQREVARRLAMFLW
jgi:hypothetical protein